MRVTSEARIDAGLTAAEFDDWERRPDLVWIRTDGVSLAASQSPGEPAIWAACIPTWAPDTDGRVFVCLDDRWEGLDDAMRALDWWFPLGCFAEME